jgi:hypothetical protein
MLHSKRRHFLRRHHPVVMVASALLGTLVIRAQPTRASEEVGAIEFHVIDVYGETLPYYVSAFASTSGEPRNYAQSFKSLRGVQVPYGEYKYLLRRADFDASLGDLEGKIRINAPTVWQTIVYHGSPIILFNGRPARGDETIPKGIIIRGSIHPVNPNQRNWVRFQSLYEPYAFDVPVDERGEFQLDHYLRGNYLVMVFDRGKLLKTVAAKFWIGLSSPSPLFINLDDPAVTTISVK